LRHAWMEQRLLRRLARAYGTRMDRVVGEAQTMAGLGRHFGGGLYEAEVRYLIDAEFAKSPDDILWRRSKLRLHLTEAEQAGLANWFATEAVV